MQIARIEETLNRKLDQLAKAQDVRNPKQNEIDRLDDKIADLQEQLSDLQQQLDDLEVD